MRPWFGLEASVTRGYPGKLDVSLMGADQALTLEETIQIHTLNGAWTLRLDDATGSIETGKSADMIVTGTVPLPLDRDSSHRQTVESSEIKVNLSSALRRKAEIDVAVKTFVFCFVKKNTDFIYMFLLHLFRHSSLSFGTIISLYIN
jgi:hypothetical protein